MAAQQAILLNGILTVTDTSLTPSPTIITRNLNNPTLTAQTVFFDPFFGGGAVALPAATVYILYAKNVQAAGNITLSFTPVGGVASSCVLLPGSVFIYFLTAETAGGITAVSVTAATSSEILVAA